MRWRLALAGAALVAGCSDVAPRVTPEFAARARARDPAADAALLGRGRELFVSACATCHALPAPGATPAAAWPRVMAAMGPRSHLAAGGEDAVLRYLLAAQADGR